MATVGGDSGDTPTPESCVQLFKCTGNNLDPGWEWNSLKDPNNRMMVTCNFCGKTTKGGITRAKEHQMGAKGNVGRCLKTPESVREKLLELAAKKAADKMTFLNEEIDEEEEEEEIQEIRPLKQGKRIPSSSSHASTTLLKKSKNTKGPIDLWMMRDPEIARKMGKNMKQTNIKDHCTKEARARVIQYIERFLIRNGIAFNVVRTKSFKDMLAAVGEYGSNLKPPSYHECRVPLLKKELEYTKGLMQDHEVWRENTGCSIMSDGWTDRKGRTLINFLVNTPTGSMFIKSLDASSYMKTGDKVFELLDHFVEEIGESKVVLVITDSGSNYVAAGKKLMEKRKHLFWTPCAAHCLDLMLEDIGKLPKIKRACLRGIKLVGYIYNHSFALNLLRKFTGGAELVRHGVTRFATTFLTLQRFHNQKTNLQKLFISDEWTKSKGAKDAKGKRAMETVLMASFWADVVFSLKAMGLIVQVLRLVDNEKKPAMGYIYEAMDKAKENIQVAFKGDENKYRDIFAIIDKRWDCQMHHPLHAAGYYLNPAFFFKDPVGIDNNKEVKAGLFKTIKRLSLSSLDEDKACEQLVTYKYSQGLFSGSGAIRQKNTLAPAEWWNHYGTFTPELMRIAVRVLSLTCSSSGCERNWSTFEHMPIKEACHVACQRIHPSKARLWKHAEARQNDKGGERTAVLQIVSYGSELGNRGPTFDMDFSDFMDGDKPISYEKAKKYFARDPSQKWAAYVAGTFLVLMTELGVHFEDSVSMLVSSAVPEGKGVSSSASVEVASMSAIAAAHGLNISPRDLALLCQKVENHIVGAPCGVMDQMASACGEANKLLAMVCQPAEIIGLVEIPSHIRVWGIDSGIRHSVGGADYGSVRIGTFMGMKMIKTKASVALSEMCAANGLNYEEVEQDDIELLKQEASLDYLCNLPPHRFEALYSKTIPNSVAGEDFLTEYNNHNDPVTIIDQKITYGVKAPTTHPIYENFRVKTFKALLTSATSPEQLTALGGLLYQCHYSYSACGLGSDGTDRLLHLVQELQHSAASKSEGGTLYGAKITGGGSGGTVCVIGRNCLKSSEHIFEVQQRYKKATGYLPFIFEGSSPGAGKFGYLKIRRRSTPRRAFSGGNNSPVKGDNITPKKANSGGDDSPVTVENKS